MRALCGESGVVSVEFGFEDGDDKSSKLSSSPC